MATGQVLFHRFYYAKSLVRYPMKTTAMACILLAAKIEESRVNIQDIINVFNHIKQVKNGMILQPVILDSSYNITLKNQIVRVESQILKDLGFSCYVEHPHKIIIMYLRLLEAENTKLAQSSWNYMNDALRTDVFVRHSPETIACACIWLAGRQLRIPLPENPPWYHIFRVTLYDIEQIAAAILKLYTRKKVKLEVLEAQVGEIRREQQEARLRKKMASAQANHKKGNILTSRTNSGSSTSSPSTQPPSRGGSTSSRPPSSMGGLSSHPPSSGEGTSSRPLKRTSSERRKESRRSQSPSRRARKKVKSSRSHSRSKSRSRGRNNNNNKNYPAKKKSSRTPSPKSIKNRGKDSIGRSPHDKYDRNGLDSYDRMDNHHYGKYDRDGLDCYNNNRMDKYDKEDSRYYGSYHDKYDQKGLDRYDRMDRYSQEDHLDSYYGMDHHYNKYFREDPRYDSGLRSPPHRNYDKYDRKCLDRYGKEDRRYEHGKDKSSEKYGSGGGVKYLVEKTEKKKAPRDSKREAKKYYDNGHEKHHHKASKNGRQQQRSRSRDRDNRRR